MIEKIVYVTVMPFDYFLENCNNIFEKEDSGKVQQVIDDFNEFCESNKNRKAYAVLTYCPLPFSMTLQLTTDVRAILFNKQIFESDNAHIISAIIDDTKSLMKFNAELNNELKLEILGNGLSKIIIS